MDIKTKSCIFGIICCVAVLPACTETGETENLTDDSIISLSATVPHNVSRGASTTTATIKDFIVYAFTDGAVLINGAKVTRDGGMWTYSPEAYWPVNPVNFYAYSPEINVNTDISNDDGSSIPGYLNDGSTDLLYSVLKNVSQQAAPVLLNFRHALSKVNILLSSTNSRIRVSVSYVSITNIYRQGSFYFPQASTLASTPDVVGSWSNLKLPSNYISFAIISESDQVDLNPQPTDLTINNLDCNYIIPQPLIDVQLSDSGYSGNYIEIDCIIYDSASGAVLWPNSHTPDYMLVPHTNTGRIVFPATSDKVKEYKLGHAYIYNIQINNPDVLDKIEFGVTVDEYSIDEM